MSAPQIEIQIIAVVVSTACAIPGTFLVLRKMAMISDAISHSILPGIVVGFFITQNISSPILVLFAALTGLLTVLLVESVNKTGLVKEDTAIGLVFPAMFSIGVILISRFAGDVHLDTHAVLVGELAFAPFDRLTVNGNDLGPKSLWVMGSILLLTLILLFAFYKELKLSTFDAQLAASLGFTPVVIHYGLMTMTSITAVGAFDAVGAILVVALMIVPASAAYLITKSLKKMLLLSVGLGITAAVSGYWAAHWVNASIGGSMATMLGIIFFLVFMFAPSTGMISVLMRRRRQKLEFAMLTFLLHLKNHQQKADSIEEQMVEHLTGHFRWSRSKAGKVLQMAEKNDMIRIDNDVVDLTEKGEQFAGEAMHYIITNKNTEPENIWNKFIMFR